MKTKWKFNYEFYGFTLILADSHSLSMDNKQGGELKHGTE